MSGGVWRRFKAHRAAWAAAFVLAAFALFVAVGPQLSPYSAQLADLGAPDFDAISQPPSFESGHWLGTDSLGRDLYVRVAQGGRISLLIGLFGALVSVVIGVAWGATAGYHGGRPDALMMRAVDVLYALPFMFFVIVLMTFVARESSMIFVALGAILWLDMARIVRGQTVALREREFVLAARALGASDFAIIARHIVPNLMGVVVVYATLAVPQVILVESFLSFLGLGVQEPQTSWGALVAEGAREMESAPWMLVCPATFLAVTLFCFNALGDGLRDALDPRS